MFQNRLKITLLSILLQKTASEGYCDKRSIFLIVHFGLRANDGPIARYATATSSNTATGVSHCNKLLSMNSLFLIIFNTLYIL